MIAHSGIRALFRYALFMLALAPALLAGFFVPMEWVQPQEPVAESAAEAAEATQDEGAEKKDRIGTALGGLGWRALGPALMSGRISDLAVDSEHPNTWYVAAGSGGVWKTENAGTTFQSIFDGQGSYSIGCVSLDPSNPKVVWVGTGEAVGGRHVGYGDGVYRSLDGGGSWKKLGLEASEHLAKIAVDPRDSRVVWVAAQGPLWSAGGERGLYKSTDGGLTWNCVLAKGEYTGCTDVLLDPSDPDVVYAALHQRHRTVWALMNGGPESGIHKSVDGGVTWTELRKGLPGGEKGKIGLALSPQDSRVVYATIELPGRRGGFWRSEDAGASWSKQSDYVSGGTGPHYYQELWADPHRAGSLYQANVELGRTDDEGKTWQGVGNDAKHVDNHAVAFHPHDPDFVLAGCDGGLYVSRDRCRTWQFFPNLPLTQFYKVDVDYDWPVWHLGGGTQDNATQYGPAFTLDRQGVTNGDWRVLIGGDGHDFTIDPTDPNLIYCESQEGYLQRFDRAADGAVSIRPQPPAGAPNYRFNWDSPILISPHDPAVLWFAADRVFRSADRGDSWQEVSGDLTRGENRLELEIMGRTWSVDAAWDLDAMSQYASISALSESPIVAGLLYAGTDDGLLQVSEDGGASWSQSAPVEGVADRFFVNDVEADRFDADVAWACVDRHKEGDFAPYLLRSADRGRTWTLANGDLPARHLLWKVIQDHERADLLFLGTEFGVFVTLDGGAKWRKLSSGFPTIPVRDLEIQHREDALVAATFGRSFYVLDDYSPLRLLDEELLEGELVLFPARDALSYQPGSRLSGARGSQGDSWFAAENPRTGAELSYWVRDGWKTRKQVRGEAERKAIKDEAPISFPGWEALAAEEIEESTALYCEITLPDGTVVNRFNAPSGAGLQRARWNLRWAGGGRRGGTGAAPGTYLAQLWLRGEDGVREIGEQVSFRVLKLERGTLPAQDPAAVLAWSQDAEILVEAMSAMSQTLTQVREQLSAAREILHAGRAGDGSLIADARALDLAFGEALRALSGDDVKTRRGDIGEPSLMGRAQGAMFGAFNAYGPTGTVRQQLEIARADFTTLQPRLRALVEQEWPTFARRLDAAGVPWTPGRALPSAGR